MSLVLPTHDPSEKSEGSMSVSAEPSATKVVGAVFYSDGSSRPTSAGFMGWGIHGYTYEEVAIGEKPMALDCYYTDQGYLTKDLLNTKFDGQVGKHVKPIQIFEKMGTDLNQGTNNIAEINGVINSLLFAKKNGIRRITIRLDSQYTRNGLLQWCRGWERNNWVTSQGAPVLNKVLWQTLHNLYKTMREDGFKIQVHWVQGHDDALGNIQADALAGTAANMSLQGIFREDESFYTPKDFWKSEVERHPFLNFRRVYFNSQPEYNTPGCYLQADPGALDQYLGKRLSETGLSSIRLYEPDPVIEKIKERQYATSQGINTIIKMEMDRVYDRHIYPYLKEFGGHALTPDKATLNLKWFDRKPVTVEVGATGLSMQAMEYLNLIENMLNKFLERKKDDFPIDNTGNPVNVHDITHIFYDKKDVLVKKETILKYELKSEYVVGFTDMAVHIHESLEGVSQKLKIPLILGIDLLPRNNLKKLEPFSPKVYLITWREGQKSLRYATVIDCDKGVGIWSNFFADRVFFV